MHQGPRPPSEQEFSQVVDFLNNGLRKESGWSIATEYPTALHPTNLHNMRIITEEDKVLSHAVIKPLIVKTPKMIFKVGAIGSVYTNEHYRGQGFSTQIINDCVELAKNQLCDIAILWTNLFDYYRRFGFELVGSEVSILFQENFNASVPGLRFSSEKNVSAESLLRLYTQHTVNTVRNIEEIRRFLTIPNTNIYTAWEANGQLGAYAVEGKGADLNGYIHEWGGSVSRLMSLFSHIREVKKSPIIVISPLHAINLLQAAAKYSKSINYGYLGMIKILNFEGLSLKIKKAFRSEGIEDFYLEKRDNQFLVGCGKNICLINSETEMTRLIFGPFDIDSTPNLTPETKEKLTRVFPLPMWLWGWDSI